jgi:chromosome segregation ATPase
MDVISFEKEMENIKENFEKIKDKINQNEKSYTLNNGTSKLELDIKHMVDNLSSNIKNLITETKQTSSAKIPLKEINRRLVILQKWGKIIDDLKTNYDENIYKNLLNNNLDINLNVENNDDKSNNEIIQITREKINQQDNMLDELHSLLTVTKSNNKEIHNEIKNQKPMIEDLDKNMDKLNMKIKKETKNIEKYDNKTSNCFLITIIWFELILMIYFIFGF